MKNYKNNIKAILELLLSSSDYITLVNISDSIGVSKRSVQNYMVRVKEWLLENELSDTELIQKRGTGIKLRSSPRDRQKIKELLGYQSISIFYGDAKRRMDVLRSLMFAEDDITIQDLMTKHYASRSTILDDLEWCTQWMQHYNLKIYKTQHRGIEISGDELAHRNAIAALFDAFDSGMISDFSNPRGLGRLNEKTYSKLVSVYPKELVLKIIRIIESAEHEFDFILLEEFYVSLLTHMVIAILRIKSGKSLPKSFLPPDEEFPPLETQTANYIADRIRMILGVELSASEKAYICIHLVGYNAFSADLVSESCSPKINHLAITLIENVDNVLETEFSHDTMLFFGLCLHLSTSTYRLKVSRHHSRRLGLNISEECMPIIEVLQQSSTAYENICGVSPDYEELIAVSYYFVFAQRRVNCPVKTLFVSNQGILNRIRYVKEIKQAFDWLDIADNCSAQQLQDWKDKNFELIISTEPLEYHSIPTILLQQPLPANYLNGIAEELRTIFPRRIKTFRKQKGNEHAQTDSI